MLHPEIVIALAQERRRDLLAEAETSRLAARLRKTGHRPDPARVPDRHRANGFLP